MRVAFFIVCCVVFNTPGVLANSVSQSHLKGKSPHPPTEETFQHDWAGFYSGLILGGQFGRSSDKTGAFGYNADHDKWEYNESGFDGGAEFGYGYPWHQLVIGPEIELGYLRMNGSGAQPASPGLDTIGKTNSDFYTTFRARLGVDLNHALLFATGGAIGVNYTKQNVLYALSHNRKKLFFIMECTD